MLRTHLTKTKELPFGILLREGILDILLDKLQLGDIDDSLTVRI